MGDREILLGGGDDPGIIPCPLECSLLFSHSGSCTSLTAVGMLALKDLSDGTEVATHSCRCIS